MRLVCVLLCVACVSVWSWSVLQFALQDLKIAMANIPRVHPLFVLYCIVYYKSACASHTQTVCMSTNPTSPQFPYSVSHKPFSIGPGAEAPFP